MDFFKKLLPIAITIIGFIFLNKPYANDFEHHYQHYQEKFLAKVTIFNALHHQFGEELIWKECPEGYVDECTVVEVPLNWSEPYADSNINLFAARRMADNQPAKGDLWFLAGGPGQSAKVLSNLLPSVYAPLAADYNIYTLDHRGVGQSTRLSCPEQEKDDFRISGVEEIQACAEHQLSLYGEELGNFRITQAAYDLSHLMFRTKETRPVFVMGLSYGTLWGMRFHQVAPWLADGLVLDSLLPPRGISFLEFHRQSVPLLNQIATLCQADPECSSRVGDDPLTYLSNVKSKLDAGHCINEETGEQLVTRIQFSNLGDYMTGDASLRSLLFAFARRLDRCSDDDRSVIQFFLTWLDENVFDSNEESGNSYPLTLNISLSEVVDPEPPISLEQTRQECFEDQILCTDLDFTLQQRQAYDVWPLYTPDFFSSKWPTFRTPILVLNGELDKYTPIDSASTIIPRLREDLGQNFVRFPYSSHAPTITTPRTPEGPNCGLAVTLSFLESPYSQPDTSCVDDISPFPFTVSAGFSNFFFGTSDAWGDEANNNEIMMENRMEQIMEQPEITSMDSVNSSNMFEKMSNMSPLDKHTKMSEKMQNSDLR